MVIKTNLKVANAECYQIEFWAKIKKCVLENPELPIEFVRDLLILKRQDRLLAEPFKFEKEDA